MKKITFLPKEIELNLKKVCNKYGVKLIDSVENSTSHQIEVNWDSKKNESYLYIDRKIGFNTKKNNIQIVIHPNLNKQIAAELNSLSKGIQSASKDELGKTVHSSQYKGFDNKIYKGEYPGAAWRISLLNYQNDFEKFLFAILKVDTKINNKNEEYLNNIEGKKIDILSSRYERSSSARQECIQFYGNQCMCCGFNFETIYGDIGRGYIHIHHIVPLSQMGKSYSINPKTDLIPLCPNCHAMIHKRIPPYSLEELREKLKLFG